MADDTNDTGGALSQLGSSDLTGILSKLAQDPINPKRDWLAYAAGALQPTRSGSFGEEFGNALGAMNKAQADQEALRASYVPHVTQALLDAAKFQRQREIDNLVTTQLLGGGNGQPQQQQAMPGQLGSGLYGDIAPPTGYPAIPQGAPAPTSSGGGINSMTPSTIAAMKYLTGKDFLPEYKLAKEGIEQKPGSWYKDPITGKMNYIKDPTKGWGVDENGNSVIDPNFISGNAAIEGAKTAATKAAENQQSLLPPNYVGQNGAPLGGTIGEYITPNKKQVLNSGFPAGTTLPTPTDAGTMVPGQSDTISILQQEIANEKDPAALAALKRSLMRAQQGQQGQQVASIAQSASTTPQVDVNGRPLLQSEKEKLQQAADVELANKGKIAATTEDAVSDIKNFKDYKTNLNKNVEEQRALVQRNQEILPLLDQFQTGRLGADGLIKLASTVQNTFPGNPTARAIATRINGGDVSAAQELNQLLSSAGLSNVIQTLQGQGRVNTPEFKALQAHAETSLSDPDTLRRLMTYQNNLYKQSLNEQQAIADAEEKGALNPKTWQARYSKILDQQVLGGQTQPVTSAVQNVISNAATKSKPSGFKYLGKE